MSNSDSYQCNLVIPGFAKCGTSSFHEYLDQHPQICMSRPKEPHFFSYEHLRDQGPAAHNRLFSQADAATRYRGESSTSYCVWEPALQAMAERLPNPRLVVLLRDPVDRLVSHYRWMYSIGREQQALGETLQRELANEYDINENRAGNFPWYLRHSRYSKFCPLMVQLFGSENVLFIKTDVLAENSDRMFEAVFDFLDLPPHPIATGQRHNRTDDQPPVVNSSILRSYSRMPDFLQRWMRRSGLARRIRSLIGRRLVASEPRPEEMEFVRHQLAGDSQFYLRQPDCFPGSKLCPNGPAVSRSTENERR